MPFLGSPITPDYIDQYHDSVLKYIRDIRSDESLDLTSDSSYITTVNLLFQRADQIAADVCGKELREMEQIVPKVLNKGYENIFAESTDPTYETIALPVEIISASNVRGIYMTDIARNISLDSVLNVTYHPGRGCFSIDETTIVCQGETFTFKLDQALADNGGIYLVIEATEGQSNGVTRPQRRDPEDLLPLLLRQLQHRRKVRHHAGRSQVGRCRSRWR